jgi:hypothetical protein
MTAILEIACDESGHTGSNLLQKDQRYFAYASVAIGDTEAFAIIQKARTVHPVQMPELKARALMGSVQGRRLIASLLRDIEGHYTVSLYDKLLSLCGWFFEYIYEPVYKANPSLLYAKNLHRFIAMYSYLWMTDDESQARNMIEQFQRYMRSRDPADAPLLFNNPQPPLTREGSEHPFESVLRFAYGFRDIIIADNADLNKTLPEAGRWTLDLSTSALWSHLNHWGAKGELLSVRCDASKPLQANVLKFTGDDNDPGIKRARAFHPAERLGWKLVEPIAFVDSRNCPAVQLADVVAGVMASIASAGFPAETREVGKMVLRHGHPHSLVPDLEVIDPKTRSAAVNAFMLYDLAKRAESRGMPFDLEAMYEIAEASWDSGAFRLDGNCPDATF